MKERDRTIIISNQVCDPEIENTRLVEGRIFFGNTEKWHLHQKLVKSSFSRSFPTLPQLLHPEYPHIKVKSISVSSGCEKNETWFLKYTGWLTFTDTL